MTRPTFLAVVLAMAAAHVAADPLYDPAAAAERQAAAQAILAATATRGGPSVTADGVHCAARSATAVPPAVQQIECRADRVTLSRDSLAPDLAGALLRAAKIWAQGVAAPAPAP